MKNEKRATKDEKRATKDERRKTSDERRKTSDERRKTSDEKRATKNERRKTSDERRKTKNERRKTSDERRATKNERRKLALERGAFGTTCVQAILRFLSLHAHMPCSQLFFLRGSESPCDHFLSAHTSLDISLDNFIYACIYFSVSLFSYGHVLQNSFKSVWNH